MGGMLCFKSGDRIKLRGIQLAETIGGGKSLATATGGCHSVSQSGNRADDKDWTLELKRSVSSCSSFLLWSSCLDFLWVFVFLSLEEGRCLLARRGVKQRRWTKWTFRAWLTDKTLRHYKTTVFSVGGAPSLTLMIVWETFKMIRHMVYWLEWIYLLIASLCNVGDNVYFSTDLLNSELE